MSNPDLSRWAAETLTEILEVRAARPPAPSARDRAADIGVLQKVLRRRARRPFFAIGAVAMSVCAAASIVLLAKRPDPQSATSPSAAPSIRVSHAPEQPRDLQRAGGDHIKPGDVVLSRRGSGPTLLTTSAGTHLSLAEDGELAVVETGKTFRFRMTRGRVHADVVPLGQGERFVIQTLDAQVEVHGTVFDVIIVPEDVACRRGTTTRVVVTQGVVAVEAAGERDEVRKGEHWPRECPSGVATTGATARRAQAPREPNRRGAPAVREREGRSDESRQSRTGDLPELTTPITEQNDILAAALAHKLRGRLIPALAEVEMLLRRWPAGPFVESAMAERMRILHGLGDARAVDAAHDYLGRFPRGFALEDANRIAQGAR